MEISCFLIEDTGQYSEPYGEHNMREQIWKRMDNGEKMRFSDFPVGAMWFENIPFYPKGLNGQSLFVRTPGGDWNIDSRASNCTMKNDDVHRCWCRHGDAPNITVNKIGDTCSAGGGSIQMCDYHGFLVNGKLTNC